MDSFNEVQKESELQEDLGEGDQDIKKSDCNSKFQNCF